MLITEKHKIYKISDIDSFEKVIEIAIVRGYIRMWRKQEFHYETDYEYAFRQLVLVVRVLNDGWVPNFSENNNEYKWWPWFSVSSGFAFSCSAYGYDCTRTYIGSRLCFKTQEISDFAGRTFVSVYKKFMM